MLTVASTAAGKRPWVVSVSLCASCLFVAGLVPSALATLPRPTQPSPLAGGMQQTTEQVSLQRQILPLLETHCFDCHSQQSGVAKGGLRLDSADDLWRGGNAGRLFIAGHPERSRIIDAVRGRHGVPRMPPEQEPLEEAAIELIELWIRQGAQDPRRRQESLRGQHWATKAPQRPALPVLNSWSNTPIDRFVWSALQHANLQPSPDASADRLLRRLYFDLIGLPPRPVDQQQFLVHVQQLGWERAWEQQVDQLMASPQFGERWGRHWLDVARFAESSGKETNVSFPHAWRYRRYVIGSWNADKPYDRFVREQIAGDLLPYSSQQERSELLTATGFLAIGPKGLNEMNRLQFLADLVDEQLDSTCRAVMASSIACARCHDHKHDPYTMEDYYALAGIFASSKTYYGTSVAPGNQVGGDLISLPRIRHQVVPNRSMGKQGRQKLVDELQSLNQEEQDRKQKARQAIERGEDPTPFFSLRDALRILWRRGGIEGRLKTVDEEGRALPLAMGVLDREQPLDIPLLERGEIKRPGAIVPRGVPVNLSSTPIQIADGHSGRRELAVWMTSTDHPLTSRVIANRIWHHLFGAGLVRTVDDFGTNGDAPSHPQLLDYLAVRMMDQGWSCKALVREIVCSRTYRQSSALREQPFRRDPDNRLLWRWTPRRLDAEAIRDAMLQVADNLDRSPPRFSLTARLGDRPIAIIGLQRQVPTDLDGVQHRSVYLPIIRDRLPDVLETFDGAEPSLVTGARQATNVPLQALFLMNSQLVNRQAAAMVQSIHMTNATEQIQTAYRRCFAREPDKFELTTGLQFLQCRADELPQPDLWRDYCQALLTTAEFRLLD